MSRLLVISDIHNRIDVAQALLSTVEYDRAILLGDYFDNFGDSPVDAQNTARWLKEKVFTNDKIIPLIGNHDAAYLFSSHPQFASCSGFTHEKNRAIWSVLDRDDRDRFQFYHIEDGIVFSHAGLRVSFWKDMEAFSPFGDWDEAKESRLDFFSKVMNYYINDVSRKLIQAFAHVPLLDSGWDRGGHQPYGGILWGDWTNFASIRGITQFVGHTPSTLPRVHIQNREGGYTQKDYFKYLAHEESHKKNSVSTNYNLDTHSKHYAIITDGQVEFYDTLLGLSLRGVKELGLPLCGLGELNCFDKSSTEETK